MIKFLLMFLRQQLIALLTISIQLFLSYHDIVFCVFCFSDNIAKNLNSSDASVFEEISLEDSSEQPSVSLSKKQNNLQSENAALPSSMLLDHELKSEINENESLSPNNRLEKNASSNLNAGIAIVLM